MFYISNESLLPYMVLGFLVKIYDIVNTRHANKRHKCRKQQPKYHSPSKSSPKLILKRKRNNTQYCSQGRYNNRLKSCRSCIQHSMQKLCAQFQISIDLVYKKYRIINYQSYQRYKSYSKRHTIRITCSKESYIHSQQS